MTHSKPGLHPHPKLRNSEGAPAQLEGPENMRAFLLFMRADSVRVTDGCRDFPRSSRAGKWWFGFLAGCCRISAIGARALAGAEWGRSCRAREKATLQMGNCVGHTTAPGLSGLRCFNFNEPSLSDWLTFLFRRAANDCSGSACDAILRGWL